MFDTVTLYLCKDIKSPDLKKFNLFSLSYVKFFKVT